EPERAAGGGRPEDVSASVDRHAAAGTGAVRPARERVDHVLRPEPARLRELVQDPAAPLAPAAGPAGHRRAVDVPPRIERYAAVRLSAVQLAREVVQDRLGPAARPG